HSLWPAAKIVHLVRDGRDVCLSAIQWQKSEKLKERFRVWRENPVLGAAYWWRWHVGVGRKAGATLGPALYYEIRYENLVRNPEQECRNLCEFLGIAYSERMPAFHEGKTKAGRDAKHAWIGITPGLRDWRRDMEPRNVALFEAAAGDVLQELGYDLASQRDANLLNHVQPLKASFAEDAQSKIRYVPEDW
ncbi:MAG TPA: sulfotransferase, partial [Acidobacteriota bacterium]